MISRRWEVWLKELLSPPYRTLGDYPYKVSRRHPVVKKSLARITVSNALIVFLN